MLIIKISRAGIVVAVCGVLVFVAGCMPEGSRALLQGKKLVDRGRYPEAIEELKAATSQMNTNAVAWDYLGLAYHHAGQITNAVQAYQRALAADQDLTVAHYNLGCLWMEQGQLERARAEFTAVTLRQGHSLDGWLRLAAVQRRARDFAGAEKSYGEALRIEPKSAEALNGMGVVLIERSRVRDGIRLFESALKAQPDYAPALLNRAIVSEYYLNNRPLALQQYREYLGLPVRPDNWESVNGIARELARELNPPARQSPTAATIVEPAATQAKASAPAAARPVPTVRQETSTNAAKSAPAIAATSPRVEVVKLPPEPAVKPVRDMPSPTIAGGLVEAGKSGSTSAGRTGTATGGTVQTPLVRADSLEWTAGNGREQAAGGSESARSPIPRYPYRNLGRPVAGDRSAAQRAFAEGAQAQSARRFSEAIQAYRRATQLDPAYYEAYYNLGLAAAEAGNAHQSLAAYEMALAIRPDSVDARYNFALMLKEADYVVDAANELEKVLAGNPKEVRAHLALGNLYAGPLEQPRKAREHYLKVLEIDPGNAQAQAIRSWLSARGP